MLSNKARYAMQALLLLTEEYGQHYVLIADLAERGRIPKKFLELILLELKNRGLLRSKKGRGGGYSLSRPADSITVGEVIRIVDGPLAPIPCVSKTAYSRCSDCVDEAACGVRLVMKGVRDAIAGILDSTTFADVAERVRAAEQRSGGARRKPKPE